MWAAVLVLSKCLCFYHLFYSDSIFSAEPEFSFTSGRETHLPVTSQGGRGPWIVNGHLPVSASAPVI